MLRQLLGSRLNHVENLGHIFFVVRQDHAGGERIRDQQCVFDRQCLEDDDTRWREQFVLVGCDFNLNSFLFTGLYRTDDASVQPAYDLVLFERRHADKDGDAIAEQGDNSFRSGAERQRQRRQYVAAFQSRGLDPVAKQKRPYGNALLARYRQIDHENLVFGMTYAAPSRLWSGLSVVGGGK